MQLCLSLVALALLASSPIAFSSYYKLNRYYDNIYAEGVPSSTIILKSGECYSFPEWFGEAVVYFDGGWKVTCYDTIQQDAYGTYKISGKFQAQFVGVNGASSSTCTAATSTNHYDVYVPSVVYDTSASYYSVYYTDGTQFGSVSFECFEAVLPPEPSGCPFSSDVSGRRLDGSADKYHSASFNVSVNFVMEAGIDPNEWIQTRFSGNNLSNPWKALDNDMIPYLNNLGTSVGDRRRLSTKCLAWGFACATTGLAVAGVGAATLVSGGLVGLVAGSVGSAYGVSFTLDCIEGLLECVAHAVTTTSGSRLLTDNVLTESSNFTLTFSYQVATTLDSSTARSVFMSAIQTKLSTNIVDAFPSFALALSYNGTTPTNMSVTDAYVPPYSSASDKDSGVSVVSIIIIVCVLGGVLLITLGVYLKSKMYPAGVLRVVPTDGAPEG